MQRLLADVGPSRWLWRTTAQVVLRERSPAAGGFTQEHRVLQSPLTHAQHSFGCRAGPLVIGPLARRGVYHRAFDPTAGGLAWRAAGERPGVALDTDMDGGRWSGVALTGGRGSFHGGYLWCTDAIDSSAVERRVVQIAALGLGCDRPLRVTVVAAESASRGNNTNPAAAWDERGVEERWLFPVGPLRRDRVVQAGLVVSLQRELSDPVRVDVSGECWVQELWGRYRPSAGEFRAVVDVGSVAVLGRVSMAGTGFRSLDGGLPRYSRRLSAGLRGHAGTDLRHRWRLELGRSASWHAGLPEMPEHHGAARVTLFAPGRRLSLRGELTGRTGDGTGGGEAEMALRGTPRARFMEAKMEAAWKVEDGEHRRSATVSMAWTPQVGTDRRRGRVGAELSLDESTWEPSVECSVPLGTGVRIAGSASTTVERRRDGASWVDRLAATATLSVRW